MHPSLMIALQVAALIPARPDFAPKDPSIDARGLVERQRRDCAATGSADEIVVCGRRDPNRYRAPPRPADYEEGPPRAETSLGGKVKGSIDVEQVEVGGIPSNRAKVTIKVPF